MHHLAELTVTQKGKLGLQAGSLGIGLLDVIERLKAGFFALFLPSHPPKVFSSISALSIPELESRFSASQLDAIICGLLVRLGHLSSPLPLVFLLVSLTTRILSI